MAHRKYLAVADLLRKRLEHGDYSLTEIPAERKLAAETNVAYKTIRRAIQQLIDEGFLTRRDNGRLIRNQENGGVHRMQIAFLAYAATSADLNEICMVMERVCKQHHATLRPVTYVHWDDTIIQDTLDGFDGVVMALLPGEVPAQVIERLRRSPHPVVVVEHDLSPLGIPSLCPFPPEMVQRLLDHLEKLGHRQIDCLNTQPMDPIVAERIQQWQIWLKMHGFEGRLYNHPVQSYEHPHEMARSVVHNLLKSGEPRAGALLCTTVWTAVGAMRAFHDHGLRVGTDVSVCAINGEGMGDFLCPSLTALEPGDLAPSLAVCLDWMERGGKGWIGPLLLQSAGIRVVSRESTAPAPKSARAPGRK